MRIGIIGGGSIGLLLSSYLSRKHEVTLYVQRDEQKKQIASDGVVLHKQGNEIVSWVSAKLISDIADEDCFIVCVKQHHLNSVFSYIKKIIKPMLFLQNGMGHLSLLSHLPSDVYVGVVEHGAKRTADNCVEHLGEGVMKVAALEEKNSKLLHLVQQLHDEAFPVYIESDYESMLKDKLIINAVINPLTAIFNIPNGAIVTNMHIQNLARQLCREAAFVLQLDEEKAWKRVKNIASVTRNNTSSMRADILHKRKTEIEAISGYLLSKNDDLPYTYFVYESVLALEKEGTIGDGHTV